MRIASRSSEILLVALAIVKAVALLKENLALIRLRGLRYPCASCMASAGQDCSPLGLPRTGLSLPLRPAIGMSCVTSGLALGAGSLPEEVLSFL